jgi:hypothetical protein
MEKEEEKSKQRGGRERKTQLADNGIEGQRMPTANEIGQSLGAGKARKYILP